MPHLCEQIALLILCPCLHDVFLLCVFQPCPAAPLLLVDRSEERFLSRFIRRIDANTRAYFAYIFTARWLGFRMDMVVIIVLTASCFVSVAVNEYSKGIGESGGGD